MQDADGAFRAVRGLNEAKLDMALDEYILSARTGAPDSFGKEDFTNAEAFAKGPYWVGVVTPALHYTMGGISISASGQALRVAESTNVGTEPSSSRASATRRGSRGVA